MSSCFIFSSNDSRGPSGKVAKPHVCSKENSIIAVLVCGLVVHKIAFEVHLFITFILLDVVDSAAIYILIWSHSCGPPWPYV